MALSTSLAEAEHALRRIPIHRRFMLLLAVNAAILAALALLFWRYDAAQERAQRRSHDLLALDVTLRSIQGDSNRLQALVRQYLERSDPALEEAARRLGRNLDVRIDHAAAAHTELAPQLLNAQGAVRVLLSSFDKLIKLNPLIIETYETSVLKAGQEASGLFAIVNGTLFAQPRTLLAPSAGKAYEALVEAVINSNAFYFRPVAANADRAHEALERIREATPVMIDLATTDLQRDALKAVSERVRVLDRGLSSLEQMLFERSGVMRSEVDWNTDKLHTLIEGVQKETYERQASLREIHRSEQRNAIGILAALALAVLAVGAAMSWLIAQSIQQPLRALMESVDHLAAGDLEREVPGQSDPDEVGALARTLQNFNANVRARRTAETALRQSEERYRQVIDNVAEGLIVVQAGRLVFANPRALELTGYAFEALRENDVLSLVHPEDRERMLVQYERGLKGEPIVERQEYRLVDRSGAVRWVDSGATMITWDGTPAALMFLSDITARRQLEDNLKNALHQQEAILQSALVGIAFGVRGRLEWFNATFAEIMHIPEQSREPDAHLRLEGHGSWADLERTASVALGRDGRYETECRVDRGVDETLWVAIRGQAIDRGAPASGTIWTVADTTKRREAEESMRLALSTQQELNELKSRFVSMTSHEFRTPLATILSSAELLRDYAERMPETEKGELLASIESAARRMASLLDDVLTLGRVESGRLEFQPVRTRVGLFCESVIREVVRAERQQGRGECNVVFRLERDLDAMLDERLMRHLLANLLSNAIKYSPPASEIGFEVTPTAEALVFTIADAGIGIPADDLKHLFDTFHRGRNVGNVPGTGLGMAIVKKAADLHGARVDVQSEIGIGTRFAVTVPRTGVGHGKDPDS